MDAPSSSSSSSPALVPVDGKGGTRTDENSEVKLTRAQKKRRARARIFKEKGVRSIFYRSGGRTANIAKLDHYNYMTIGPNNPKPGFIKCEQCYTYMVTYPVCVCPQCKHRACWRCQICEVCKKDKNCIQCIDKPIGQRGCAFCKYTGKCYSCLGSDYNTCNVCKVPLKIDLATIAELREAHVNTSVRFTCVNFRHNDKNSCQEKLDLYTYSEHVSNCRLEQQPTQQPTLTAEELNPSADIDPEFVVWDDPEDPPPPPQLRVNIDYYGIMMTVPADRVDSLVPPGTIVSYIQ